MNSLSLKEDYNNILNRYNEYKAKGFKLDMSRGKPCSDQLDLSNKMITILDDNDYISKEDIDCRNYGIPTGIIEIKNIFSQMISINTNNIIVGGGSSLNLMYDLVSSFFTCGVRGGTPWCKLDKVKFLCPTPGYDRHFAICEHFNIEMVPIPILKDGPDMDMIESLIKDDESIKGMWCVPKYSNPEGVTYSDTVVKRIAKLSPKAKDFALLWDNAYALHKLYDDDTKLLNIFDECQKAYNGNLPFIFASFSKISFAGSGISCIASSDDNIKCILKRMSVQIINYDKINQLRHVRFFKDIEGVKNIMNEHAKILRPKFILTLDTFEQELAGLCNWTKPLGGYFISFYTPKGCAKKTVSLAKDCGLTLVNAGSAYPYGIDKDDSNIRIAPSYLSMQELKDSLAIFCTCVKLSILQQTQ